MRPSMLRRCGLAGLAALLLTADAARAADPPFRPLGSFDRVAVGAQTGADSSGQHRVWVVSRESTTRSASVLFLDRDPGAFAGHRTIAWTPGAATLAANELVFPNAVQRVSLYAFPNPTATAILDTELDAVRTSPQSYRSVGRPRWIGTSTGTRLLVGVSEAGAVSIRPDGTGATVLPNTAGRGYSGVSHDLFADGRAARTVLGESTTSGQWSNLAVDLMPSGSQLLMDTPFIDEGALSLSPDGSEIAFLVEGRPSVIRTDGTGQRSITPDTSFTYGPPAWSADGTRIGFVARSPRANSRAALYSVKPDGSDFARHTAQFGDAAVPPAFPSVTRIIGARVSWGKTCTTILNCSASLSVVSAGPTGFSIETTPRLDSAASIGFLVERYNGRRLRRAGRVPFGTKRRGRARERWGLRLNGKRLRPGRYRITLRSLARGIPVETARPRDLIVRRQGKPRLARPRVP